MVSVFTNTVPFNPTRKFSRTQVFLPLVPKVMGLTMTSGMTDDDSR
ncbi:hypothetical protein IQ260_21830 [Leptolyngbya cf. ectocarpi LEGE 11479]|uniref:Uncharacterized protein n=1 Tax=Leptolyngbya cf. ectocarpi LEGE 11479 TaxID=1828722 RepID=A0A928ZXF9_LEPEC|nr:hypothetical protein [Leptolyngbya cf. ectocarpi LEGE 11479]